MKSRVLREHVLQNQVRGRDCELWPDKDV